MREGLLLVAHGSRSAAGQREIEQLTALVAAAAPPDVLVDMGYLELSHPPAGVALDRLVAAGARQIAVVPLMLLAAGHSKSDVPAVVLEGRQRHPGVTLGYGRPLGVHQVLIDLAQRRIRAAGVAGAALALIARGTSDPDANADACKISRLVAEATGADVAVTGFSGVTRPDVPTALEQLHRLGASRIAVFSWFLATGILVERIGDDARAFSARTGVEIVDAGHFGPSAEIAGLVLSRAREAATGAVRANCDTCVYRAPFPGASDRVGQARGEGHSHLA
ncbi:MAG: sirohydrochlorin chelatase, partial [Actinobacteria bacterium]|nr:sirohydrochlorin chelatase [Actinomycetota bacterium]